MKKSKLILQIIFLCFLVIGSIIIIRQHRSAPYQHNEGFIFGTIYHITYQSDTDLQQDILAKLQKVDNSLSPFNKESIISHVNRNEPVKLDKMFLDVFNLAEEVSKDTHGAFDITVAPLVNAWGFGFKSGVQPTKHVIDSIRNLVGFEKVRIQNGMVVKKDPRIMLDCSAIAKGYGSDVVARFLRNKGINNFMIEIGGEIVVNGTNEQNKPWKIGVSKPIDDSVKVDQDIQTVLNITNIAMATSGNYRKFYYKNGKKYAHTIDPKTGYPVQHNILSSTVLAKDCATADAYATSFMVMGLDKARKVLERNPDLMAYFIYSDKNGKNAVWFSPKMKEHIQK